MEEDTEFLNERLAWLWGQSTGGGNVAVHLGGNSPHSKASPRPPGVEEGLEWLRKGLDEGLEQRMLFLVGGPGAGKSHAARQACEGLAEVGGIKDGLAHRTYRYRTTRRDLLVINDATIGSDIHEEGALRGDLEITLDDELGLLACINRGVVVEELSIGFGSQGSLPFTIIEWLHAGIKNRRDVGDAEFQPLPSVDYLRAARIRYSDGRAVYLLCVLLDVCSLLESRPTVVLDWSAEDGEALRLKPYSVLRFNERPSADPDLIPAVKLLGDVIENVPDLTAIVASEWNPFEANRSSLCIPEIQVGFCSLLRASEIVSTMRLTYRELWGGIVRALLGRATDEVASIDFGNWLKGAVSHDGSIKGKFESAQNLAAYRFSEAIFGNGEFRNSSNPVCRLLRSVDPVRDATPGRLTDVEGFGWATPVTDAFAGGERVDSPLESLLAEIDPKKDRFHLVVTDFDRNLDQLFMEYRSGDGLRDSDRNRAVSWYGAYLLRLYAIANGIPAFRSEVTQWTQLFFSREVSTNLRGPMSTLLLPSQNPDSAQASYLLPLLDSRTVPIQGKILDHRLAVRGESFEIAIETHGDSAQLLLLKAGEIKGRIECDFALVREAVSCAEGHLGITEFTHTVSPRLERLRASQLSAVRLEQAQFRVVSNGGEDSVVIGQ